VFVLIQGPLQGSIQLRSLPSDSPAADLPPEGDDHSGEGPLARAKRLAAARDFKAAILCLQEGLQLAPEDGVIWCQLARLLLALGCYGDAITCLIRLA